MRTRADTGSKRINCNGRRVTSSLTFRLYAERQYRHVPALMGLLHRRKRKALSTEPFFCIWTMVLGL